MKRIGTILLSLVLVLMVLPAGLSYAEEPEATEPEAEAVEVPDELALLGTWVVVDGEGTDYDKVYSSRWNDGDRLVFVADYRDGERKLIMGDLLFVGNIFDYATLENGMILAPATEKALEEDYLEKYSISYRFEDAADCDPLLWEKEFAQWVDISSHTPIYTPEMVKGLYEANTKDKLILHITGAKRIDAEEPTAVDTTLVLEKVLPVFFNSWDSNNLNGTWTDGSGYFATFVWDEDGDVIKLTDPKGVGYTAHFGKPQAYAENGEIRIGCNFYFENDNDPSAASLDVYVSNLTFDGLQLVITLKTGESIVLTPVIEPAA